MKPATTALLLSSLAAFACCCQLAAGAGLRKESQKIAFFKTHKTGSTTFGSILARYAVRHDLEFLQPPSHYVNITNPVPKTVDLVFQHIKQMLQLWRPADWFTQEMVPFYTKALGTVDFKLFTTLRQPVSRYISDYYYFTAPALPEGSDPWESFLTYFQRGKNLNRMCVELGLFDKNDVFKFIASPMFDRLFSCPIEYLDFCLALLSDEWGWDLLDVVYLPVNENVEGAQRWDNKPLMAHPSISDLNQTLIAKMEDAHLGDQILYHAAVGRLMSKLASAPASVFRIYTALRFAQQHLFGLCEAPEGSIPEATYSSLGVSAVQLKAACQWLTMIDLFYEKLPKAVQGLMTNKYTEAFDAAQTPIPKLPNLVQQLVSVIVADRQFSYLTMVVTIAATDDLGLLPCWLKHHIQQGADRLVLVATDAATQSKVQEQVTAAMSDCCADSNVTVAVLNAETSDVSVKVPYISMVQETSFWSMHIDSLSHFLTGSTVSARQVLIQQDHRKPAGLLCVPAYQYTASSPGTPALCPRFDTIFSSPELSQMAPQTMSCFHSLTALHGKHATCIDGFALPSVGTDYLSTQGVIKQLQATCVRSRCGILNSSLAVFTVASQKPESETAVA